MSKHERFFTVLEMNDFLLNPRSEVRFVIWVPENWSYVLKY